MTYIYSIPNATSGIDDVLLQTSTEMPSLIPLLITSIWFFIFLTGYIKQRNREGYADASQWSVLSSLISLIITLLFTTINIINISILSIVVGITILTGIWYFLSRSRYDN